MPDARTVVTTRTGAHRVHGLRGDGGFATRELPRVSRATVGSVAAADTTIPLTPAALVEVVAFKSALRQKAPAIFEPSSSSTFHDRQRPDYLTAVLWTLVLAGTAAAAYVRYDFVMAHARSVDLSIFVRAARYVAAGRSPYLVTTPSPGYVYTPILAILLAPLSHLPTLTVLRVWTVVSLASVAIGAGCITKVENEGLRSWQRPLIFGLCANTAYALWPVTVGLVLGQADLLVLSLLCVAALARSRGRARAHGVLMGVAGLMKVWPVLGLVYLFGRGVKDRKRTLIPLIGVSLLAPLSALAFGGVSSLTSMVRHVFDARSQSLISYSVWGIPKLWYSLNAHGDYLDNSVALQVAVTALLAAFVVWLLYLTLRKLQPGSSLAFWNCFGCVILLLPVSHVYYTVYFLPLLWHWASRAIRSGFREPVTLIVVGVLVIWWLTLLRVWPTDGSSPWSSSLDISVVFLVNLMACSASVLGAWVLERRRAERTSIVVRTPWVIDPCPSGH